MQHWMRFIKNWPNIIDPKGLSPPALRYAAGYFILFGGLAVMLAVAIAVPARLVWLLLRALGVV
jgi:hypothetical protein